MSAVSAVSAEPTSFAGVDLSTYTLKLCAKQGLVREGKWVFTATGRRWSEGVMYAAAGGGHLEFAKWARAQGCQWASGVLCAAAEGLEVQLEERTERQ